MRTPAANSSPSTTQDRSGSARTVAVIVGEAVRNTDTRSQLSINLEVVDQVYSRRFTPAALSAHLTPKSVMNPMAASVAQVSMIYR
jgi:hypothetical protein